MSLPRIQSLIIKKLGEYKYLTEEEMNILHEIPTEMSMQALEKLLMDDYQITEFQILVAKAKAFDMNPFCGKYYKLTEHSYEKLDEDFCQERRILPIGLVGNSIIIALSNPFDLQVVKDIQVKTTFRVGVLLATEREIDDILGSKSHKTDDRGADVGAFSDVVDELKRSYDMNVEEIGEKEFEDEESAPVILLANRIVEEAYYSGASDIHIEPHERECRVRIRIDGRCYDKITLPLSIARVLVSRLKVMANLDIAEKRLPQDGRIGFKQFTKKGIDIDLRISTSPFNGGEGIVMRILDKSRAIVPMEELGYESYNLVEYEKIIQKPYGMILHCGPTGSGKTTTLYSALNYINKPEIVIRTAEDPVEYTQHGLCQLQVHQKIGLTFATALRSFLRQDPDVILVGEIRDKETATIAIEAALTGHLLFSTLHTNDAPSSITRLLEIGIEPFMISASLLCVCAQRLLRKLCRSCRQQYEPEDREVEIMEKAIHWVGPIYGPSRKGCPSCRKSGYKGRVGIHELMIATEKLITKINKGSDAMTLKYTAVMDGMKTLHQDSMMKVKAGLTSLTEAIATVPPDLEDLEAMQEEFELEVEEQRKKSVERKRELKVIKHDAAERKRQTEEDSKKAEEDSKNPPPSNLSPS